MGERSMKKTAQFIYFFGFGLMLFSVTALAYIDPSAMTYMIQLVAGIAIAAGAGASYYFRRIKRKFSRRGQSRASLQRCDDDDDDDTGYGDYELDMPAQAQAAPSPAPAAEASGYAPRIHRFEDRPAPAEAAYTGDAVAAEPDPYDETGGTAGLIAENRELRRLLAQERRNVEELKRALHICTAPRK